MTILASALALAAVACGGRALAQSSAPPAIAYKPEAAKRGAWSFVSRPDLHPARLHVTTDTGRAAPGYLFVTPGVAKYGETGPLIVDSRGDPVWVGKVPVGQNATNFRVQTYQGKPVLTWWQGKVLKPGYGDGTGIIADSSYHVIARVRAGNGLKADVHDFTITPQGYALITAYKKIPYDLSSLGGSRHGKLLDSLVQVVDIGNGKVLFQWDPLKHVPLTDSYMKPVKRELFDPYHVNSVALWGSGSLLISVRHTWTVYNVDTQTGAVVWRMGGKHSDLALGPGVSFAWQHAAFPLGGGQMALFDNEAAGTAKHAPVSSALVLQVNEAAKTATLLRRFSHSGVLASSQGDVQALPNGDYLVGWGSAPNVSEYAAGGSLVWDARFYKTDQSYRAFKAPWTAHPTQPPAVAARDAGAGALVSMSWNGATEVAKWQVLEGSSRNALKIVATVPRTGFETAASVGRAEFYQVRPLSVDGHVLSVSAIVRAAGPSPAPAASASSTPAASGSATASASPAPSAPASISPSAGASPSP